MKPGPWRIFLGFSVLLAAAWLVVPRLPANVLRGPAEAAVERALHRKIEFSRVHYLLLPGPGFALEDVVVHDDPSIGPEPAAYATRLRAHLSWTALLRGRVEFGRIVLEEPSLNLTKRESGDWNLRKWYTDAFSNREARGSGPHPPAIHLVRGRVNFKFGEVKSSFFLNNVELVVSAAEGGGVQVQFEGEPARTDRAIRGIGVFAAEGRWSPGLTGPGYLDLELFLEGGLVADFAMSLARNDYGLQGRVSSRARLSGTPESLSLEGELRLEGLHGSGWLPFASAGWAIPYRGSLDTAAQELVLELGVSGEELLPVSSRVRVWDLLQDVRWAGVVSLREVSASSVIAALRRIGVAVPPQLSVEGNVTGVAGYSPVGGLQGRLRLEPGRVRLGDPQKAWSGNLDLIIDGSSVRLPETTLASEGGETVHLSGVWEPSAPALQFELSSPKLSAVSVVNSAALFDEDQVPFLSQLQGGVLNGTLRYRRRPDAPALWSGEFELTQAQATLEGVAERVTIRSGHISLRDGRTRGTEVRGKAGQLDFRADFETGGPGTSSAGGRGQTRLNLAISKARVAELRRIFLQPAEPAGFLFRPFRINRLASPAWLSSRDVSGRLQIGALEAGPIVLTAVEGVLGWKGASVRIADLQAMAGGGRLFGSFDAVLGPPVPEYRLSAYLDGADTAAGDFAAELEIRALAHPGRAVPELRAEGTFEAQRLQVEVPSTDAGTREGQPPEKHAAESSGAMEELRKVYGDFEVQWGQRAPVIRLFRLQAESDEGVLTGAGRVSPNGLLELTLQRDGRTLRLAGHLY